LLSDVEVMSLFGLLLMFDVSRVFVDKAPVGICVPLDELSVESLGLSKTVQSGQCAIGPGEGYGGYRICSEPGVVTGDSQDGYDDMRDTHRDEPGHRGEP
jgi:hypothetical protein